MMHSARVRTICREDGAALLMAMMCLLLMSALGAALMLTTSSETLIADYYRRSIEGAYAAAAAMERALDDLLAVADWNQILGGAVQSTFTDGPPTGARRLADGSALDLVQATNLANCQKTSPCSAAELDAITPERPWGANNPRWRLYAYGPLSNLLSAGALNSPYYVLVFAADDSSENDADPLHDGVDPAANKGSGVLALRAEALGPRGTQKVIELTVARVEPALGRLGVRMLSWRETR